MHSIGQVRVSDTLHHFCSNITDEFALSLQGSKEELKQWDISFWAERLREAKFNITDEELRPYFALPNVLKGLFQVCFPQPVLPFVLIQC